MAKRALDTHVCTDCGFESPRWFGRCPDCGSWSSAQTASSGEAASGALEVTSLETAGGGVDRSPTGLDEVDRVLGGGLVAGSVILIAGEPGVGKSTLVLQVVDGLLDRDLRTLLVTGEESVGQVGLRAKRLRLSPQRFRAAASSSLEAILASATSERPDVLVVDSVQTLHSSAYDQAAGSVVQVRECAATLTRHAKATGTAVILVGHVTKDGSVAGPKTLEHVVDAVLTLEGERTGTVRLLRAAKNRFGSCEETGVFVMDERGLTPVADPSAMLLEDRRAHVSGSVVFPGLEGTRPMLVELQALAAPSELDQPRRVTSGVDSKRMALLLGVLARRAGLKMGRQDVFVSAAGGLAVREPAADLALCIALASAATNAPAPPELIAIGEVGLGGEIRRVPGVDRRLAEAARMGFRRALVPRGHGASRSDIELIEVADLSGALASTQARVPVVASTT